MSLKYLKDRFSTGFGIKLKNIASALNNETTVRTFDRCAELRSGPLGHDPQEECVILVEHEGLDGREVLGHDLLVGDDLDGVLVHGEGGI